MAAVPCLLLLSQSPSLPCSLPRCSLKLHLLCLCRNQHDSPQICGLRLLVWGLVSIDPFRTAIPPEVKCPRLPLSPDWPYLPLHTHTPILMQGPPGTALFRRGPLARARTSAVWLITMVAVDMAWQCPSLADRAILSPDQVLSGPPLCLAQLTLFRAL